MITRIFALLSLAYLAHAATIEKRGILMSEVLQICQTRPAPECVAAWYKYFKGDKADQGELGIERRHSIDTGAAVTIDDRDVSETELQKMTISELIKFCMSHPTPNCIAALVQHLGKRDVTTEEIQKKISVQDIMKHCMGVPLHECIAHIIDKIIDHAGKRSELTEKRDVTEEEIKKKFSMQNLVKHCMGVPLHECLAHIIDKIIDASGKREVRAETTDIEEIKKKFSVQDLVKHCMGVPLHECIAHLIDKIIDHAGKRQVRGDVTDIVKHCNNVPLHECIAHIIDKIINSVGKRDIESIEGFEGQASISELLAICMSKPTPDCIAHIIQMLSGKSDEMIGQASIEGQAASISELFAICMSKPTHECISALVALISGKTDSNLQIRAEGTAATMKELVEICMHKPTAECLAALAHYFSNGKRVEERGIVTDLLKQCQQHPLPICFGIVLDAIIDAVKPKGTIGSSSEFDPNQEFENVDISEDQKAMLREKFEACMQRVAQGEGSMLQCIADLQLDVMEIVHAQQQFF